MRSVVIIPTYNEHENLIHLIPAILAVDPALDIVVVDDNSQDGTGALADRFARETYRVRALHREGKLGLGTAYLMGFHYALARRYDYVLEMDADFSHDPADLPRLVAPVAAGEADFTIGSRWVAGGGTRNWPRLRQVISRGGSAYARTILDVSVFDLTGGFKCFRRRVLKTLDLNAIKAVGYGFQIELTYRALQAGFRLKELPIIFTERTRGKSKMSPHIFLEALVMVLRLRLTSPVAQPVRSEVHL